LQFTSNQLVGVVGLQRGGVRNGRVEVSANWPKSSSAPVPWRLLAKDGAALDQPRTETEPASQIIGVGETYDFEYVAPAGRTSLWLEVRSPGGKWLSQGRVIVQ
jgi:hypothetical protein